MSWSGWPCVAGENPWATGKITQLADATRERLKIFNETSSLPAVSDHFWTLGSATRITFGDVAGMAVPGTNVWVQSHELDGTPRAASYYNGATDLEYWTTSKLCEAAGYDPAGIECARPAEFENLASGTLYEGGSATEGMYARYIGSGTQKGDVHQRLSGAWVLTPNPRSQIPTTLTFFRTAPDPGDYVSAHLLNQLKAMISLLVWTHARFDWYNPTGTLNRRLGDGGTTNVDWADAKADAETSWNAVGNPFEDPPPGFPMGFSQGNYSDPPFDPPNWNGIIHRRAYFARINSMPSTLLPCAIDFFGFISPGSTFPGGTFDAQGNGVVQNLSLFNSLAAATGSTRTSSATLGSVNDIPAWCAEPGPGDQTNSLGWTASEAFLQKVAILRWNVSGGLVYV